MRHSLICMASGAVVGGTLDLRKPRLLMANRISNDEAFPGEHLVRLPRRWTRDDAWQFYARATGVLPRETLTGDVR